MQNGWPRARWVVTGVLLAVVLLMSMVSFGFGGQNVQCDGEVPEWMIPADYDKRGLRGIAARMAGRPALEHRQTESVCLGYCNLERP